MELRNLPLTITAVVRKNRTCCQPCCLLFSFWVLMWGNFKELLEGFGVGEEGVLAGLVASHLFVQQRCHQDRSRQDLRASISHFLLVLDLLLTRLCD